jgi:hypothetical protein
MRNALGFLFLSLAVSVAAQTPTTPGAGQPPTVPSGAQDPIQDLIDTKHITSQGIVALMMADKSVTETVNRNRTDIQLGTASGAPHATSIVEKPGIADLLSLAIDRGAITKTSAGTGLTLSTTPYAIITGFGAADTPDRYDRERFARNLSMSSTFSSNDVTSGNFSSFTSGELKYVILGNRSPRDAKLINAVRDPLAKAFAEADQKFMDKCRPVVDTDPFKNAVISINNAMKDSPSEKDVRRIVDEQIATISADPTALQTCFAALRASDSAMGTALDTLSKATKTYLEAHRPQLSIATLYVRDKTTSDYYSAKVLYAYDMETWTASLNGAADWNRKHVTDGGIRLRTVRDYSVEAGANTKTMNNGMMDYSLSAKWSRDKDASAKSVILGEAKANVHINATLRLPVGVTFSNRGTATVKKGWQLNVGLSAFLDDILRNAAKKP